MCFSDCNNCISKPRNLSIYDLMTITPSCIGLFVVSDGNSLGKVVIMLCLFCKIILGAFFWNRDTKSVVKYYIMTRLIYDVLVILMA